MVTHRGFKDAVRAGESVVLLLGVWLVCFGFLLRRRSGSLTFAHPRSVPRDWAAVFACAAVLAVSVLGMWVWWQTARAIADVRAGHAVAPVKFLGVTVLGFQAQAAVLRSPTGEPADPHECLIYLAARARTP